MIFTTSGPECLTRPGQTAYMETSICEWSRCPMLSLLVLGAWLTVGSLAFTWMTPSSMCQSSHPAAPGSAPPIPSLPLQYSMKVETNILRTARSVEVEEHYDSINQRASVSVTRNGTTVISIFNFKTEQRYDIHPDGSCETRPASVDYMGFVSRNNKSQPVMAPVNEVFRFGAGFNMTYVGRETVRGITVNHWTSCQMWSRFNAKFQMDYYFSDADFTTATGMSEIPVRAVLNGSAGIPGRMYVFQNVYEFMSFRAGPVFNEEVFQIPAGIVCSGRSDNKPLPLIPDELEMSLEIIIQGKNRFPHEEYILYDYNHKLVETIKTMVAAEGLIPIKFGRGEIQGDNSKLMAISGSVVKDFNSGIVYVTEMINMTCSVRKMPSALTTLTMSHGQSLFTFANSTNQFMYQGQTTFRTMLVDVWATEQDGVTTEVYFMPKFGSNPFQTMVGMFMKNRTAMSTLNMTKIFQEVFQSEIKFNEADSQNSSGSSSSPPKVWKFNTITADQLAWGLQLEHVLDYHLSTKMVNIFHYSPLHLDTTNFQVSHCYEEQETSEVMLVIKADYYQDILFNFVGFSNSLRSALALRTSVSLLHISNLALAPYHINKTENEAIKATFTLLGAAPIDGISQKSIGQTKHDLESAIANGITFRVQYTTYSKEFMVHKSIYELDCKHTTHAGTGHLFMDEHTESSVAQGQYSPGTVAGIAIGTLALGAVLSTGVLYLLYRWKHPGQPLIPYQQHSSC